MRTRFVLGMVLCIGTMVAAGGDGCADDSSSCGPSTCLGCCVEGSCVPGTTASACGTGGYGCLSCEPGQTCPAGTCEGTTTCGNGTLDFGEQCDDGNRTAGDGCDSICQREGGADADADADADGDASGVERATATLTGAQFDFWDYDGEANYISCVAGDDLLGLTASPSAGSGDHDLTVYVDCYTGLGRYEWTYSTSASCHNSVDVSAGSGYNYWSFYDYSRIDFHEVYTHCVVDAQADPAAGADWIHATVTCEDLIANITSPDYEDHPTEFQPRVGLVADFRCQL
jgi:cysteine-rich repeat protein